MKSLDNIKLTKTVASRLVGQIFDLIGHITILRSSFLILFSKTQSAEALGLRRVEPYMTILGVRGWGYGPHGFKPVRSHYWFNVST